MKRQNQTIDKSAPYRTTGFGKISAPEKPKSEPKASKIKGEDLRGKK